MKRALMVIATLLTISGSAANACETCGTLPFQSGWRRDSDYSCNLDRHWFNDWITAMTVAVAAGAIAEAMTKIVTTEAPGRGCSRTPART
jgi:hypothetical protein